MKECVARVSAGSPARRRLGVARAPNSERRFLAGLSLTTRRLHAQPLLLLASSPHSPPPLASLTSSPPSPLLSYPSHYQLTPPARDLPGVGRVDVALSNRTAQPMLSCSPRLLFAILLAFAVAMTLFVETEIRTPSGLRTIGSFRTGDKVWVYDRQNRPVLATVGLLVELKNPHRVSYQARWGPYVNPRSSYIADIDHTLVFYGTSVVKPKV